MNAAARSERPWMRRTGLAGTVDGGTGAVLLLWMLMFFLLPARPGPDGIANAPAPVCMISARAVALDEVPLAQRPDLIAIPSSISFGAVGPRVDTLYDVPPFQHHLKYPLPVFTADGAGTAVPFWETRIKAAAAQEAGRMRAPDWRLFLVSEAIPVSPLGVSVLYDKNLGRTRWNPEVLKEFGSSSRGRRLEAEVWIAFDSAGCPSEVFLEKSSGDAASDRELVRKLWNPAGWSNASGQGRISIRWFFRTGGTDANTESKMESR